MTIETMPWPVESCVIRSVISTSPLRRRSESAAGTQNANLVTAETHATPLRIRLRPLDLRTPAAH